MNFKKIAVSIAFILALMQATVLLSQTTFYDIDKIQKIEISFVNANWDYQLDTAKIGADGYLMAEWVKINGVTFDSAGVKYKGNSSYDSTYLKNPIHIALNEFKSHSYQGFTDIKLSNGHADPSMIREVLSYDILKNYMDCPRSNFAQVYINGQYTGLFTNVESINRKFCSNMFFTTDGAFIKANPVNPGPYTKSNLKYISSDSSLYYNLYELKSNCSWSELMNLCNAITNNPAIIEEIFDTDRVLWMLAFNNLLVNLDSYSGAFAQNYYLYKDQHGQFNPIVWDLNMSFGGFPFAGSQGGGMGSLNINQMQNLSLNLHASDIDWPLIKAVLSNYHLKKVYFAHLRTLAGEMFENNLYLIKASQIQSIIDTAVQSDMNKFFTFDQFLDGMTANVSFGNYIIPGISVLMEARCNYLNTTAEFMYLQPTIESVTHAEPFPQLFDEVYVTAQVSDANVNSVFLNYRFDKADNFTRILMYDDGNHHDGNAGDSIFGAVFIMQSIRAEYYIYAENDLIGKFSPARAEKETYVIVAEINTPQPGAVVINEFLTINQTDTTDENGQHEDWIELFNNTDQVVSLFGLYISDDFSNPFKFAFPENTIILPHDYLIIWADEDNSTPNELHCNFKLSGNGEELLLSDFNGTVIDSISFGTQTADISSGRCPDGIGEVIALPYTSFNKSNCTADVEEIIQNSGYCIVFPNPVNQHLNIISQNKEAEMEFTLRNIFGEILYSGKIKDKIIIDVTQWAEGLYMIICQDNSVYKIIVQH